MDQPRKINLAWLLIFFFLLQLGLGFLVIDGATLSFDESIWHYIGRNWLRYGLIPYTGGVDNKCPFMFAIYGFSDLLFGLNYWFPRILGALAQTIGIFFLFKLVEKIVGYKAAIVAISIYGLSLAWKSTGGKYIAYTESYEISLILTAFYFFFRNDRKNSFFISGCLAGLSIFFRLTGIFGAIALLFESIKKGRTSWLFFLAGLASSSIFSLAIMAIAGIPLQEIFIYGFTDNFGKGSISGNSLVWKVEHLVDGFFLSDLALFIPGLVGYMLIKKRVDVFVLWFLLTFIGINLIGLYARQHFRDLLPCMSVMTAVAISFLMDRYQINWKAVLIITWISFFPKQIEPLLELKNLLRPGKVQPRLFCDDTDLKVYDEDKRALGEWVQNNSSINERVYIAGMSAVVQVYANRLSPTIYFNNTETKRARKRLLEDLASHKPDFILIPTSSDYLRVDLSVRKFIDSLLAKEYRYETCQYNYAVFRNQPVAPTGHGSSVD
ncbi:MAG TPA: glycosyltransferase family 39 protein [Chitinophagaceae bacterium]|nr:glycosyltransferase family 39 protein [Chitinophagaceae bacterium]